MPTPPPWWMRHPAGAAGGAEQGVEQRPVGDGVGAVPHRLGLPVGRRHRAGVEVVAPDHDRRLHLARRHQLVEAQAHPVALAVAQPADAGGQALERHPVRRQADPAGQRLVRRGTRRARPGRWRRCRPGRRTAPPTGTAPCPRRTAGGCRRAGSPGSRRPARTRRAGPPAAGCCRSRTPRRRGRRRRPSPRSAAPSSPGRGRCSRRGRGRRSSSASVGRQPGGHVAERVVGRRLVGDDVDRARPSSASRGSTSAALPSSADRQRVAVGPGRLGPRQGVVEVVGGHVEVAGLEPAPDAVGVDLDDDGHAAVHGHGQRLGAAHAPEARR